jgi:putative protein-disulfide isomerase
LCSWCYGFGPELTRVLDAHEGSRADLVMGGLRPYTKEPMSAAFRQMIRGHWDHVAEASGQPFSNAILERDDFVYDTEPPCRAVVTARTLDPTRAFALMKSIQHAFYAEGRDVTRVDVLAQLAAGEGYEAAAFRTSFESEAMREATRGDFREAQSLGVSGFPTLALRHDGQLFLVASGFTSAREIEERIAEIVRRHALRSAGAA